MISFSSLRIPTLLALTAGSSLGFAACSSSSHPASPDAAADSRADVPGLGGAGGDGGNGGNGGSPALVPCVDGGAAIVLATTTAPAVPQNLTIDATNIYFTTQNSGSAGTGLADSVMTVPLTGGTPTLLASGQAAPSFTGATYIALAGGNLYWAANSTVFPNLHSSADRRRGKRLLRRR
jgi:hypothetical protein